MSFSNTEIGVKINVYPKVILSPIVCSDTLFFINSAIIVVLKLLLFIVKLNVVKPKGVPNELNIKAFDVGVKAGLLVNPPISVTVAFGDAHCWLNSKLNKGGRRNVGSVFMLILPFLFILQYVFIFIGIFLFYVGIIAAKSPAIVSISKSDNAVLYIAT